MRTIDNIFEAAERINIENEITLAFEDCTDDLIRLQKEQMRDGMRSDDTPIFNIKTGSEYYSDDYARYKGKDSPIDLFDRGDFQGEIIGRTESEGTVLDSENWKSEMLKKTYGEEIFGLGEQGENELVPIAQQQLYTNIEKELNNR